MVLIYIYVHGTSPRIGTLKRVGDRVKGNVGRWEFHRTIMRGMLEYGKGIWEYGNVLS